MHTTVWLVQRVIARTKARVLKGDTHVPDKVVSLFEPHTTPIRKDKLVKPTEFGHLVSIQEAEGQIITRYAIHDGRLADVTLWIPALDAHTEVFGHAPDLAVSDRRFASAATRASRSPSRLNSLVVGAIDLAWRPKN